MSTSTPALKSVIVTEDGKIFNTKAEANDYLRKPRIEEALMVVTGNKADLTAWLIENKKIVDSAFETGTIKRVTKSEKKRLATALERLCELQDAATVPDAKLSFLVEHSDAVLESFRHPGVKRMTPEEKHSLAITTLEAAANGNTALAEWVIANKDAILNAYDAGKIKRKVSEKALTGLAEYHAKRKAEKEAKEAAEAAAAADGSAAA